MTFSSKPNCTLVFMILFTLVLSASTLDDPNEVAEAPAPGPDSANGFLPLAEKHVVVHNVVRNKQTLNIHCKSSEHDLGLIHIPWGKQWDFRFHVNMSKSAKYRCHLTWYGGGSHYFDIFKVSRDDNPFGQTLVCKECIWEVGGINVYPMCRINRDGSVPYCFEWDDQ